MYNIISKLHQEHHLPKYFTRKSNLDALGFLHRQRLVKNFFLKTVHLHELPERTNPLKYLCGALFELPLQNIPDQSLMRFHDGENEAVCRQ